MSSGFRIVTTALVALALGASVAHAEDPAVRLAVTALDASEFPTVRLVVTAVDSSGRPLKGLTPKDLQIVEGSTIRSATVELASRTAPVALALALDTSGSMSGTPFADAQRAVTSMVRALGPGDQAALITFSTTARVAQTLTGDTAALAAATAAASAAGNTAIYDALALAAEALAGAGRQARRAIVLLTDGVDTSSRTPRDAVVTQLRDAGYPVYIVGLGADLDRPNLEALAGVTRGGRFLVAPTSAELAAVYESLSEQLFSHYTVTFRSLQTNLLDGSPAVVELQLVRGSAVLAGTTAVFLVPPGRGAKPAPTLAPPSPPEPVPAPGEVAPADETEAIIGGLTGAASVLALLAWAGRVLYARRVRRHARRRVGAFVATEAGAVREEVVQEPFSERVLGPILNALGRPLLRIAPGGLMRSARRQLTHAGDPLGLGPVEFFGIRLAAAATGAALGSALFALTGDVAALGAPVLGAALGYAIPGVVLGGAVRSRQRAILRVLPSALDILAVSLEAGLAFDAAVAHVARTFDDPLSGAFRRLFVEFQMGRSRGQAMRDMAERTGLQEVRRFVEAIVQAEALGVSYSRVIQEQAAEIRTAQRQKAEEVARVAPVKMIIPMVMLIFPALFIVLLGPVVPRLLTIFGSVP